MIRQSLLVLGACISLFACPVFAGAETIRSGDHFRVVCDFDNKKFAAAALETAESVWPVAAELLAAGDRTPSEPIDIHLFRTVSAYEKVESELTGGKFTHNWSFSTHENPAAYIVVQPNCSDDVLRSLGLPALTRRLIAHEAAHLVVYASIPNYRSHPKWFAEGMAIWVTEQVLADHDWTPGLDLDPNSSTTLVAAAALVTKGEVPTIKDILQSELGDIPWRTRYAVWAAFFRFLKTEVPEPAFRNIIASARRFGGGSGYVQKLAQTVIEQLGRNDINEWDRKFAQSLAAANPQWEEVYRSLEIDGDDWHQTAFTDKNAIAWHMQPVGHSAYVIEGKLKIHEGGKQQLNLLLGRRPDGFVTVAFVAGYGVTVFDYQSQNNSWERIGDARFKPLRADRWMRFRVVVQKDVLSVHLKGKAVLPKIALRQRSVDGPWGVGAQAGSAGIWRNVVLDKIDEPDP